MHPELFRIGSFPIKSYGVLLMIGVIVASYMASRRAPRYGLKPDVIWDSLFWMVIPGILGARITFIVQNWSYYSQNTNELFSLQFNGLTSFGGLILGFVGLMVYIKVKKLDPWAIFDSIGVPVLIGHAFGRIGCLLNGCCFGYPCGQHGAFCVHVEGHQGEFLPAQAYDAGICVLIALALIGVEKKWAMKPGSSFFLAVASYGLSRFIFEFWRAGPETAPGVFAADLIAGTPITKGQAMALVFVAVGLGFLIWRQMRPSPPSSPTPA